MRDMTPTGWGDPARRSGLPAHATDWLRKEVGTGRPSRPAPVTLSPPALSDAARKRLEEVVGAEHVRDDDETRLVHAAGKSYLDLLRVRRGGELAAPDAVVLPG